MESDPVDAGPGTAPTVGVVDDQLPLAGGFVGEGEDLLLGDLGTAEGTHCAPRPTHHRVLELAFLGAFRLISVVVDLDLVQDIFLSKVKEDPLRLPSVLCVPAASLTEQVSRGAIGAGVRVGAAPELVIVLGPFRI